MIRVDNGAIAKLLTEMADVLELKDENSFKIRALRNAAQSVETAPHDLAVLARGDEAKRRLQDVPGIGPGIAAKIIELCTTGACAEHTQLLSEFPRGLLELLQLSGIGVKTVRTLHEALRIRSLADLEAAARQGLVRGLPRMSAKTEEKILQAIARHKTRTLRSVRFDLLSVASGLLEMLRALPGVSRAEIAGSFRRKKDTVGDLDFLVTCRDPAAVSTRFAKSGEVIGRGATKTSIRLESGLQCDLRIVPEESFGAALQYFTGSKEHVVALRLYAQRRGLTINEYGVFEIDEQGNAGARLAGATEEEVYRVVGLAYVPPELRENHGELEAAARGSLPALIEAHDLRGDLHMHTVITDGSATIEEMAAAAAARGHGYVAITDHTKALAMVRGLDDDEVRAHAARIRQVDAAMNGGLRVLAGIEVDILENGDLDLAAETLAELDVVIGSVHSRFGLGREEMTARIIRAIESGKIDIVGHPTGRLILKRDPYDVDMEAIMSSAKEHGVALELNGSPYRLDLCDNHCRMAKELGVKVVLDSDAHSTGELSSQEHGLEVARRAGFEKADILNTRECDDFLAALHEGHRS